MMLIILIAAFTTTAYCQISEVAFSFGLDHDMRLPNATVIKYDLQYTNIGGGYDSTTGKFVAPKSGLYLFQFHLLTQQNSDSWLELHHNSNYIASAFGSSGNDYASAGNSVILSLTANDEVYIEAVDQKWGYLTSLYGRKDEVYSTFSGYLISTLDQVIPAAGK